MNLVNSGRSIPAIATSGVIKFLDFLEAHQLHALDNQLSDTHSPRDLKGLLWVVIDEAYFNLTTILSINGAGGIHDGNAMLGRQARPRVDQAHRAHRQGKGNARTDKSPLAGPQSNVVSSVEIRARIAAVSAMR